MRPHLAVEAGDAPAGVSRVRILEGVGPTAAAEPFLAEAGRPSDDPGEPHGFVPRCEPPRDRVRDVEDGEGQA